MNGDHKQIFLLVIFTRLLPAGNRDVRKSEDPREAIGDLQFDSLR